MSKHILRHSGAKATTVKCPECGDVIVYNGNYFCNSFKGIEYNKSVKNVVLVPGTCSWALPHPVVRPEDRNVVDQLYRSGHIDKIDYN